MKAIHILPLVLACALVASAEPAPPSPPIESVIVTAPAQRPEDALNQFIISHAAATPLLNKIARWKAGVCPLTIGLPDKFNTFITQRIIRMAMMAGAPLDHHEPCRPNLLVLATDQPQGLLDFVRAKRPDLLSFHYRPQRQQLATMRRPIQAWYSTATEDFDGFISADLPSWQMGYGVMSAYGFDSPRVSGNRATGDGLKSELTAGITDIDATYLRGLYKMDAGRTYFGERASIAYEMKKNLEGY